jgi:hypothetical protein
LLKGQVGDEINVLMAACAWNLRKWLVIATIFLLHLWLGLFSRPLKTTPNKPKPPIFPTI